MARGCIDIVLLIMLTAKTSPKSIVRKVFLVARHFDEAIIMDALKKQNSDKLAQKPGIIGLVPSFHQLKSNYRYSVVVYMKKKDVGGVSACGRKSLG